MTDQGNDPTSAGQPAGAPHDEPTQVDLPPVGDEPAPTQVGMPPVPPAGEPPAAGPGGGEPPDRRPWILAGLLGLIALVAILLLVLGGDDDESSTSTTTSSSTTTSESTTTSTTTASTTTTTEATTTTTTEAPPVTADPAQCRAAGSDPTAPEPAAQAVFIAWTRGDDACARELMTDAAFSELFARDGTDASDIFQGCTEQTDPDPHMDCAFTYEGGATHYLMQFSPTDGWQVFDITQVAD